MADEAGKIADQTCTASRGGLFNSSQSNSWVLRGDYPLGLERNLGYDDSGTFGLDTISLGFSNDNGGPTLKSQVVTGIATEHYYVGRFGLSIQGTHFPTFNAAKPSYLTTLKSKGLIPSLSWAYTAGAKYRECTITMHCFLEFLYGCIPGNPLLLNAGNLVSSLTHRPVVCFSLYHFYMLKARVSSLFLNAEFD